MKKKNFVIIVGLVLACIVILGATLAPNATKEPTATNEPTLIDKTITQNGTYNASDFDADGFSSVTVDVTTPEIAKRNFVINFDYDNLSDQQDWVQGDSYTSYYIDNTWNDEEETLKLKVNTSSDYAYFDNDDSPFWVIDDATASFNIYCDDATFDAVIVAINIYYSGGGTIYYQDRKVEDGKFCLINDLAHFETVGTVYISGMTIYGYCNK